MNFLIDSKVGWRYDSGGLYGRGGRCVSIAMVPVTISLGGSRCEYSGC